MAEALIDSWATCRPSSEHLQFEVAVSHDRGRPLDAREPVPGCGCPICSTYLAGGTDEDAAITVELVRRLAQRLPSHRLSRAEAAVASWSEVGCTLPSPARLVELAARVPGAIRDHAAGTDREPLPVETARRASLLVVAERLGLGTPEKPYRGAREYVVQCFMHDDEKPSLRLDVEKGLWYCDPCAIGGDVIELVRRVRGIGFADAVREAAA